MRIAIASLLLLAVACGSQVAASPMESCLTAIVFALSEHRHDSEQFGIGSADSTGVPYILRLKSPAFSTDEPIDVSLIGCGDFVDPELLEQLSANIYPSP